MSENSRRGAPRSARATDRITVGRDQRGRGASARGGGRSGQLSQYGQVRGQPGQAGRGGVPGAADTARLTGLLEPVLAALEMDLEAVRLSSAGRRRVLRIVVDADGGVSLDDIAEVSREVSARLDARNAMGEAPYTLEVSSPGVDRPLTEPRHWRRAAGRLVEVTLASDHGQKGAADDRPGTVSGRVIAADQNGVALEIDGVSRTFGYPELGPGRVQVEFGRLADADDADDLDHGAAGPGARDQVDRGEADETDANFTCADSAAGEGADEGEPRGH